MSECTLTVKPAPKVVSQAVVPVSQQPPREITHTIQTEDIQRDTLEIEEQKTITDREVGYAAQFVYFMHIMNALQDCTIHLFPNYLLISQFSLQLVLRCSVTT